MRDDAIDSAELTRPPTWLRVLVIVAYVITPLLVIGTAMMAHDVWNIRNHDIELIVGTPLFVLVSMLVAIAPRRRVSRWQRAVVAAIVAQAVLLPIASFLLADLGPHIGIKLTSTAPRIATGIAAFLVVATIAWAFLSRGEVPRLMRAGGVFALTLSLALGLMLPIAAALGAKSAARELPMTLLLGAASVPALGAAIWVGTAKTGGSRRAPTLVVIGCSMIILLDSAVLPPMRTDGYFMFLSGLHVLLACFSVTVAAMVALAFMQWWSLRGVGETPVANPPHVLVGTVEADDEIIGWFRYLGPLRGMRTEVGSFWLRTDEHRLAIPRDARLIAALPPDALAPRPGDRIAALHRGDSITVRGFVAPAREGFREHAGLVPGRRGISVLRVDEELVRSSAGQEVVLAIWRPFAISLAVATASMFPMAVGLALNFVR